MNKIFVLNKMQQRKNYFTKVILFIIAISAGLNNIVIGFKIFGVSIDRIIQIILFFILFKAFSKDLNDKNLRFVIYVVISFLFLSVFNNFSLLIQGEDSITFTTFLRDVTRVIMYGIFVYLLYYLFKNDYEKLNIILFIQFLAFLLAFFQNSLTPLTELSLSIKQSFFFRNMISTDLEIYNNYINSENRNLMRVTGPYGQVVTLSYSLVVSAILAAFMKVKTNKDIYIYYLLFLFLVSVMSLTRSAFGAILIILLYFILRKNKVIYIVLGFGLAYLLLFYNFDITNFENYLRLISTDDSSAQGKIPLWITGIVTILLHPFGITSSDYTSVKEWMYSVLNNPDILKYPSHNGIINLGFQYTIFGLFLFFIFLKRLFKMSKNLNHTMQIFWVFAFISYLFQQSFHNNGIFYVEFNVLIIISLFILEVNNNHIKNQLIE